MYNILPSKAILLRKRIRKKNKMSENITYNHGNIIFETVESGSARRIGQLCEENINSIVIEDEQNYASRGIFFKVRSSIENWTSYLGILYESSIGPQIAAWEKPSCCCIGFDMTAAFISCSKPVCINKIHLPFVFWNFVVYDSNHLIIIHELGAICIDKNYQLNWKIQGHDKLNDYHIKENELICIFDNDQKISKIL